jgi:hypothetical protein
MNIASLIYMSHIPSFFTNINAASPSVPAIAPRIIDLCVEDEEECPHDLVYDSDKDDNEHEDKPVLIVEPLPDLPPFVASEVPCQPRVNQLPCQHRFDLGHLWIYQPHVPMHLQDPRVRSKFYADKANQESEVNKVCKELSTPDGVGHKFADSDSCSKIQSENDPQIESFCGESREPPVSSTKTNGFVVNKRRPPALARSLKRRVKEILQVRSGQENANEQRHQDGINHNDAANDEDNNTVISSLTDFWTPMDCQLVSSRYCRRAGCVSCSRQGNVDKMDNCDKYRAAEDFVKANESNETHLALPDGMLNPPARECDPRVRIFKHASLDEENLIGQEDEIAKNVANYEYLPGTKAGNVRFGPSLLGPSTGLGAFVIKKFPSWSPICPYDGESKIATRVNLWSRDQFTYYDPSRGSLLLGSRGSYGCLVQDPLNDLKCSCKIVFIKEFNASWVCSMETDIPAGSELYLAYGGEFWMVHAANDEILYLKAK